MNTTFDTKKIDVEIVLCDTLLLAPAGFQSLAQLGKVIGMPKVELPQGHAKDRMDALLYKDTAFFVKYAITDSIISLSYWTHTHLITQHELESNRLFHTVGSISITMFLKSLKKNGIKRNDFFGKNSSKYETYFSFASKAYHGGRNETINVGLLEGDTFFDVDLAGAYSIVMGCMPYIDYDAIEPCQSISQLVTEGAIRLAEVEFSFREHVIYPSLPIKTPTGLIYARSGTSICTSYELQLALRQGCSLKLISSIIIPKHPGDVLSLKQFVAETRAKRALHKKGTLENNFYKLVLNSLYGRFGLGIARKNFFDYRSGGYQISTPSFYTNPYIASLITGFIRAVLSELAHELHKQGKTVISMTTDGLIVL